MTTWSAIPGGRVSMTVGRAPGRVYADVVARLDLEAPAAGLVCRLAPPDDGAPPWGEAAPEDGRLRVVLRGSRACTVTIAGRDAPAQEAKLEPGGGASVEIEHEGLDGSERLLVAEPGGKPRVWQLPGLLPHAWVRLPDATGRVA